MYVRRSTLFVALFVFCSCALQDSFGAENGWNSGEVSVGQPLEEPLSLCDCHYAEDNLVSCERDGFFVAGYQHAGYRMYHSLELLPLSPAICCRPCLPDEPLAENDKAVAVVTATCQTSDSKNHEQCGSGAEGAFLQGFQEVVPSGRSYFPKGDAQCCSASLLLSSGLVQPLKQCNCQPLDHHPASHSAVSCGSQNSLGEAERAGKLVTGFSNSIAVDSMYPVPSAPVVCCQVCIDHSQPPLRPEDCAGLNYCHDRGQCRFGKCECEAGWSGSDCGKKDSKKHSDSKGDSGDSSNSKMSRTWVLVTIVSAVSAMVCCCKCLATVRAFLVATLQEDNDQDEMNEPMLSGAEDEEQGGRGPGGAQSSAEEWSTSEDEDSQDEDQEQNHQRRSATTASARTAVAPRPQQTEEGEHGQEEEEEEEQEGEGPDSSRSPPELDQGENEEGEGLMEQCGIERMEQSQPSSGPKIECAVCMSSPIQVVCVPCGHACMCRKCSRRLRRCPLCRMEVTRRQKLYINFD